MKKQALLCMLLAGTLMVGGCGQKAADPAADTTAQVTETSDSAPADKPDGAPGENSDRPGNPPDGTPGNMDGKQAPPDGEGGPGGPGGTGGQNSAPESYDAVSSFSEDKEESDQTYASTGKDESAVLVTSGASVTLNNFTIDRTSTDSTVMPHADTFSSSRRLSSRSS